MSFVHLHVHSHYSLLDGLAKIPQLVAKAKEFGMPALALTDHGALYGVIEFYIECKKNDIKPIIGIEAYVAKRELHYKKSGIDNKSFHITLLAQNETGYKNLMKLSTIGFLDGFYYKPRIDRATLRKYSEGVICLSGCPNGELRRTIVAGEMDKAHEIIEDHKDMFGDNYYIELQLLKWKDPAKLEEQQREVAKLVELAKEHQVPIVASNDVHYIDSSDTEIQDIMVCIQTGKTVDEDKRLDMRDIDISFYSPETMQELFADYPEAIENTLKIAQKCELELDLETWHYPSFQLPKGEKDADTYLRKEVEKGAKELYGKITPEMVERIDYELDIINYKKYADYFLIFADFMQWAREQGIFTTARGSASGSFVSYCLKITSVDPLRYKLPFDRFLTKFRPSPPDIDADIEDGRRDEVIEYVKEKYGHDKVAQVCTFGTMMARGSFRDVSRALGKEVAWADRISKMIPFGSQGFPMTLEKALEANSELQQIYDNDPEVQEVYAAAQKIEGCARHVSVHAAAVILTPNTLTDYVPLQIEPKGRNIITQYDMYKLDPGVSKDSVGVLKMDFLGLRNLSILSKVVSIVEKRKGEVIDIYNIPLEDKKTFEMLASGHTVGVFQLSGAGMTKHLKELEPAEISHLIAMVALYRPGPMEIIPEYVRRKRSPETITYPDPRLKDILEMSYGLFIYQDDILLTAIKLAGYEPDEADAFRKAMGKKIPEVMAAQKEKFFGGCVENGLTKEKAEEIWNLIEPFASYGFNKAHAASYGMLAYRTAYLKANFTSEYMTSLMSCEAANADKVAEAIKECASLNIEVLPPDVNESRDDFTYVSDSEIRFGLNAIKNLGNDVIHAILYERKQNGPFESLESFLTRVKTRNLNKKSIEALVQAGALDSFGDRGQMYHNVEKMLKFVRSINNINNNGQASLFGNLAASKPSLKLDPGTVDQRQLLDWEKDLLGLYVSNHPFKTFQSKLPDTVRPVTDMHHAPNQQEILVAGVVTKFKKIYTKKNEPMMFVEIEDMAGVIELIVFPRTLRETHETWAEGAVIVVKGKVSEKDGDRKLIVDKVRLLTEDSEEQVDTAIGGMGTTSVYRKQPSGKQVVIYLATMSNTEQIADLKSLLEKYPGNNAVVLECGTNGSTRKIITKFEVNITDTITEEIEHITGTNTVKIVE